MTLTALLKPWKSVDGLEQVPQGKKDEKLKRPDLGEPSRPGLGVWTLFVRQRQPMFQQKDGKVTDDFKKALETFC